MEELSYYDRASRNFFAREWHQNIATLVRRLLPQNYDSLKHLDIGCGDGFTIRMIKPQGMITGVDVDPVMLRYAAARGIQTVNSDIRNIPMLDDNSFDLITCLDVLEHVEHPTLALAEAYRILRRDGFFILTTPNVTLTFRLLWWMWTNMGMGKYWKSCPHVHTYNLGKTTKTGLSLIECFRDVGFKPEQTLLTNWGMTAGLRAVKL